MNDTTQILLQTLLKFIAGSLVTKGILSAHDASAASELAYTIVGAVIGLFALAWHKAHADKLLATPPPGSAPSAPASGTLLPLIAFLPFLALPAFTGCALLDKPLPGQTTPAPLVAFTNGTAYLLGHAATSNEVYTAAHDAAKVGTAGLLLEFPTATNYISDAQVVFESFATGGTFSLPELTNAIAQIGIKNAGDETVVSLLGSSALSLAGLYVAPLISEDTNAAPYIHAALHGIADGL